MQLKNEVQLKPYRIPDFMDHLIRMLKEQTSFTDQRCLNDDGIHFYREADRAVSISTVFSRKNTLETPLCWENYAEKFKLLLYLEELQMKVDIRRYNIPNEDEQEATMEKDRQNKKLLILKVL